MRLTQLLRCTASAAILAAFAAGSAHAQSTEATTVDEIVVTAQKREQNLQDVPIVVTTLSAETLAGAGVRDIKDLTILTPGLTVTSTTSETITTARIRGVGTVGDNPGLESSVGVVIDGVYRPRNGVGFGDLGEMQRIEVLKGPQGTLFGKNTSAGVINIITQAPSFDFGFNGEATVGNYGARGVSASVTGPITEHLAGRFYAASRQRDGFYDVRLGDGPRTNREDQDQDFYTLRGQLLFQPTDNASIRVIADYSKRDEFCCTAVQIRSGPTAAILNGLSANGEGVRPAVTGGFGPTPGYAYLPFSRTAYTNRDTGQHVEDKGISVEANFDVPGWNATVTSITAARFWDSTNGQDIDFSGADVLYRADDGQFGFGLDTLSQEFRIAGQTDRMDWQFGAFFSSEDLTRKDSYFFGADYTPYFSFLLTSAITPLNPAIQPNPGRIGCFSAPGQTAAGLGGCLAGLIAPTGPTFAVGQGVADRYSQESHSYALFTNETFHVTDAFDVTVGLRYTTEDKSLDALQDNLGANGAVCAATVANQGALATVFGANAATFIGNICLPWANPGFDNRATHQENTDNVLTGTIKGQYRLSDETMVYASYARGYKGSGFNLDRVQNGITPAASTFFPEETVDSYELGAKNTLLNRSLLLNATLFYQRFEDFQLNTFLGTAFVVESIPEVTTKGVDLDTVWFTPVEGLTFQGGATYARTEYGNFTAADLAVASRFGPLSLLPGNQVSFAPEWSVTGAIQYERSLGNGLRGGFNLAAKYTSEYNTKSDLLPAGLNDAMTLLNGRITIGSEDDRWTLELWGQNLTDHEYKQVVFNGPLQGTFFQSTAQPTGSFYNPALDTGTYDAFLGAPRTFGATLRVKF